MVEFGSTWYNIQLMSTPLYLTYSKPSEHEDSPGTTQCITYLLKNSANRDWATGFSVIFEVRSPAYITKSAIFKIWVFWVISMHYITLFVIDIHNIRCLETFLPLWNSEVFGNQMAVLAETLSKVKILTHFFQWNKTLWYSKHILSHSEGSQKCIFNAFKATAIPLSECCVTSDKASECIDRTRVR